MTPTAELDPTPQVITQVPSIVNFMVASESIDTGYTRFHLR